MTHEQMRRWLGFGLGAATLVTTTVAISYHALAQDPGSGQPERRLAQQPPPGGEGGGGRPFPGRPGGGPGFGGPGGGFPGGPGFPGMGPGMMGGGGMMTANANTVFILRGNTLYAFDASTLRMRAKAELPMPEGFPGGPGGPGFPGGRPGGGPGQPGEGR